MKALIVYHSKTGHTEQAAYDIARGLESQDVDCTIKSAVDLSSSKGSPGLDLRKFDIILVGSPTYGNRGYRLPARQVDKFLDSIPDDVLDGKVCGAFTVNAGVGGSMLQGAMEITLSKKGGKVVQGGPVVKAGAPLSLWKGPSASSADVKACEEYGRAVARFAKDMD